MEFPADSPDTLVATSPYLSGQSNVNAVDNRPNLDFGLK